MSIQKKISSAALHQNKTVNSSRKVAFDVNTLSLSGKNHVTHNAHHLETILTLCTGSEFGENLPVNACHTS
ncbi:MAG: hypothetical protein U9Q66_03360 [Patescibacteria group bacterium]|nr:hypothetical protein [Patescibacteria group bacterium]